MLDKEQIIVLRRGGHSAKAISEMVGVTVAEVEAHLRYMGYL